MTIRTLFADNGRPVLCLKPEGSMGHVNLKAPLSVILRCLGAPEFDKEAELFSDEHFGDVPSTMGREY